MFIFIMCTKTALGLSQETLLTFTGANLLLKYDILIYIHYDSMILLQRKKIYKYIQTAVYYIYVCNNNNIIS
jgi:hypothetical protein